MLRVFSSILLFFVIAKVSAQDKRFNFTQSKMGDPLTITFYHSDAIVANQVANNCFSLVDSLVAIYSDYIDSSELNRLCKSSGQNKYIAVSPALYDILLLSQKAYKLSYKTFDISIGPLTRIWRKTRKEKRFPEKDEIAEKKKKVGFDKIKIDTLLKTICLTEPGMQLDLGGIAQGYISQKVLQRLKQLGTVHALVDVSGDITIGDAPPGKNGWVIGVNLPENSLELFNKKLLLQNCAVSTSGDMYQFIHHDGKKYSHIINPRTGYGVTTQRNATVVANDAVTADWLATAACILSVRKVKRLAKKVHAEVFIGIMKKKRLRFYHTKGLKKYWQKQ